MPARTISNPTMPLPIARRAGSTEDHRQGRGENPAYLRSQLITYLGNKRSLLGPIEG